MNERTKKKIVEKIKKIENGYFLNDDVELLLKDLRDFVRENNFLRLLEFCDFVVHPNRDKGISYYETDVVYTKFKYAPSTNDGDKIDWNNIPKNVFELLFGKGINFMSEDFLLKNLKKNHTDLKSYIKNSLFIKNGDLYRIKDMKNIEEVRNIQKILGVAPSAGILNGDSIFNEIIICISILSKQIKYNFDINKIKFQKNNFIMCILEIIQNCNFNLHDGNKAKGHITVGPNNSLYKSDPKIENLNLSLSIDVPVEKCYARIELIPTSIIAGQYISNLNSIVEWNSPDHTFGTLKQFNLLKNK